MLLLSSYNLSLLTIILTFILASHASPSDNDESNTSPNFPSSTPLGNSPFLLRTPHPNIRVGRHPPQRPGYRAPYITPPPFVTPGHEPKPLNPFALNPSTSKSTTTSKRYPPGFPPPVPFYISAIANQFKNIYHSHNKEAAKMQETWSRLAFKTDTEGRKVANLHPGNPTLLFGYKQIREWRWKADSVKRSYEGLRGEWKGLRGIEEESGDEGWGTGKKGGLEGVREGGSGSKVEGEGKEEEDGDGDGQAKKKLGRWAKKNRERRKRRRERAREKTRQKEQNEGEEE